MATTETVNRPRFDDSTTYEELVAYAREQSRVLGRYAAVVTITTYMQERPRVTVAISTTPIESMSRRSEFVGVGVQFFKGQAYGANGDPTCTGIAEAGDDGLPF